MNTIFKAILAHMWQFRMSVPAAIAKLFNIDVAVAKQFLRELQRRGYIDSAMLTADSDYFYLLPRAAEQLDVESVLHGPLNGTPKVEAYGTLFFCCIAGPYRPLVLPEVFRQRLGRLYRPGPRINYYTEGRKLGYIRVDTRANSAGDCKRVIDRAARDIQKRSRRWLKDQKKWEVSPEFEDLVHSGRFVVTVLTAFPQKATRIVDELNRMTERHHQYRTSKKKRALGEFVEQNTFREFQKFEKRGQPPRLPPPVEVHAIPGLIDLMYPIPKPPKGGQE